MSKSYKKVPSYSYRGSSFKRNKHYRSQCRKCINREKTNPVYGDVVFPSYKSFSKASRNTDHNAKNEIRQGYYLDIQETLNGYTKHRRDHRTDGVFVELVNRIKGLTPNTDIGREWYYQWPLKYYFEWLNDKEVKKAVKTWSGDPFDLLKYLTDTGYVEKAVRLEYKLRLAK